MSQEPQVHGFPQKKSLKNCHEGQMEESAGVSIHLYLEGSLILDRAAKQMECQAAGKKNRAVSAHTTAADNKNLDIRNLKQ